jgi:Mg2+ and Co2+ transporter CorA
MKEIYSHLQFLHMREYYQSTIVFSIKRTLLTIFSKIEKRYLSNKIKQNKIKFSLIERILHHFTNKINNL